MIQLCAWCNKEIGHTDGPPREITHGICEPCRERFFATSASVPLSQFLDRLGVPVFLMNEDARVVAANAMAAALLGQEAELMAGELVGTVVECAGARRPGGCGKAVGCNACVLRSTIELTFATGRSHRKVSAIMIPADSHHRSIVFEVSTEKVEHGVLLRVDGVYHRPERASTPTPSLREAPAGGMTGPQRSASAHVTSPDPWPPVELERRAPPQRGIGNR